MAYVEPSQTTILSTLTSNFLKEALIMVIASLVVASLTTLSLAQDDRDKFGCGIDGQRCCSDDIIEDTLGASEPVQYFYIQDKWCWDLDLVCFQDKCVSEVELPCGKASERCCSEDEFQYGDFIECIRNLRCVEGQCLTIEQLPCGGLDEPCCEPFKYVTVQYDGEAFTANECFLGLYCLEGSCKGQETLPCGQDGERCCQLGDIPFRDYYDYSAYSDDFCFSPAQCNNAGECSTCNKAGDTCCVNKFKGTEACEGSHLCEDGVCVACGQDGMQCCPEGVENSVEDFVEEYASAPCYDGLDCLQGLCQYCGYQNSNPCYDGLDCLQGLCQYCGQQDSACCKTGESASCKLNDLVCNGETEKCELCGNMDEMCCGNNRCNADFLQCVEGVCTCGGEGQNCCAGVCAEGLQCSAKGVCS